MRTLLWILFLLAPAILFGQNNDLQNMANLASKYYQEKEFGKAAELYEQLYSSTKSEGYFNIYFDCLLGIPDYDKAEKAIKKGLRGNSADSYWYVQWGFLRKAQGQMAESGKMYEKAISALSENPTEYPNLANQFINRREYEFAEKVYIKARASQNPAIYNYELARIYYYMRNYDRMLNEYLEWMKQKESNLEIVKSNLQSVLSMDNDGDISKQLKNYVLKRIQQEPAQLIYNRLLIWLFVQDKNFVAATRQAIALDKRTGTEDANVFELANVSASNKYYDEAVKAYDYLISKGKKAEYYNMASQQRMRMNYERFIDEGVLDVNRAKELQNLFNQTFVTLGISAETVDLQIAYAHLLAFYLNQSSDAIKTLTGGLALAGINMQQISTLKAELSDVYVYSGDLWEAVISYSQVIESNKATLLGDDVKFKKAQLGYYMGNFSWAKAQLDALRASTSKLIANDAMELSLFISENLESDSTATPLKIFARADLHLFRNNFPEALTALDSVSTIYPDNSLIDDVDFRKAGIFQKLGKYEEALVLLNTIVKDHSWEMLADDALFQLATIYEDKLNRKSEAMGLFKKILTDYPGSVYVVDARTEYRKMEEADSKTEVPVILEKNKHILSMKRISKAYIYALLSVVLWSTVATAFKLGLMVLSPIYLILLASAFSLLVFFIVILLQGKIRELFTVTLSGLGKSALLGALNPFGYYLILFQAYNRLPAQVAQPLNMIWPVTLALLSAPLLKQKITVRNIVAILVSFVGVIFISSQGSLSGIANTNLTGALLAVGSSVIWALFWILSVLDKRDEIFKLFWNFAFGLVYLLIAAFLFTDFRLPDPKGLPAAIYIGLFELGITYILWMKAMQLSENNAKTGNLIFLSPFLSLVFIHFILGETIFITTFIGLAFIISGIWYQQKK